MKQHFNRIFSALLALVLCVGLFACICAPAVAVEGTSGDNLTWSLENGVLTISGSGKMRNFLESRPAPWLEYADQIQCVKVAEGITNIGNMAFYHCTNLVAVVLPASVTHIGQLAFAGCSSLTRVELPAVEEIGFGCFYSCSALSQISLPNTLRVMGDEVFYHCSSLAGIEIPASVESFGSGMFAYCVNMVYAKLSCQIAVLPYWTFYGCERLTQVYLPGSIGAVEDSALRECPNLVYVNYIGAQDVEDEIERQLAEETIKKPIDTAGTTVTYEKNEDSTIVTKTDKETGTTIEATVNNPAGWEEVVDSILDAAQWNPNTKVEVQIGDDMSLPEGALSELVNKNVTITIQTPDNVDWEVEMSDQTTETLKSAQNFRVSFIKNTTAVYASVIGKATSYTITLESTGLNSTVYLPLGIETARQVATLYQINGSTLERLCSVVIDDQGKAAFPLAGTTPGQYILALNVEGISSSEVRIPNKLAGEYGDGTLMDIYGNKYIVTGMSNQLGFGAGTMTLIIIGVLVGSAVVIGVVMTMWNKQRKKAYAQVYGEDAALHMPMKSGKPKAEKMPEKDSAPIRKISLPKLKNSKEKIKSDPEMQKAEPADPQAETFSALEEKMRRRKASSTERKQSIFGGKNK